MGAIEDVYADVDADVSEEEFREAVEAKVEQMGGLADEETAAMLIAHELADEEVDTVADVEADMAEVKFLAKVLSVGEVRTFERDDADDEDAAEGRVVNVEAGDETGRVRLAFWDEQAVAVADGELAVGDVLRIKGRPKEGYNGLEVSVQEAEVDDEVSIDVDPGEGHTVDALSMGQSDVNVTGQVLATEPVRTFDRDDGSEGRVSNLLLGDETGHVRMTLWDEMADRATELSGGDVVEVIDGYVRERDGSLELHAGEHSAIDVVPDGDVQFQPEADPIGDLEVGDTADVAGVVRSADPKRTFDRDDGSEGQVRNVRVQDDTDDVRVALWSEHADADLAPGDEVFLAGVEADDGWQDDLELAANWSSTVVVLEDGADVGGAAPTGEAAAGSTDGASGGGSGGAGATTGLDAFADGADGDGVEGDGGGNNTTDDTDATDATDTDQASEASEVADATGASDASGASDGATGSAGGGSEAATTEAATAEGGAVAVADDGDHVEFTGTVVQTGDPVVLDDGERTVTVETDDGVTLGEQVTVRGEMRDEHLDADDVI